ncbi:YjzD family protein [Lysinibacillus louembei]|uniref:YjzD family protein n=2 Tax=Bacillales TaxID=1385 RepID=A0ABZ0RY57_9BACI|nr:YjzD family protein [Lysinibacillus louembei]WPK12344.1 YjzD family protein [Lysinibacillus louembei]
MQYIMTFFWSFLLVSMLTYVVSSILGVDPNFGLAAILSVAVSILVFIIAAVLPSAPVADTDSHH